MPVQHGEQPHLFCGGCKLVLPNGEFAKSQRSEGSDEKRQCRACVGSLQCRMCGKCLPGTDFSNTQRSKAAGTAWRPPAQRKAGPPPVFSPSCMYCLPERKKPYEGVVLLRAGGEALFWKWAMAVHRALRTLPVEVVPKVVSFLSLQSWGAEFGELGVCAVCNNVWNLRERPLAVHRHTVLHQRNLKVLKDSWGTMAECLAAARAAGLGEAAEAQLKHVAPALGYDNSTPTSYSLTEGEGAGTLMEERLISQPALPRTVRRWGRPAVF